MDHDLLAFHSEDRRVCCNTSCGRSGLGLSACSRCKVYRYCSRDCQAVHWKTHKKACKRPSSLPVPPPMEQIPLATRNEEMESVDSDLDTKYKYIIVTPPLRPTQTQPEFWSTTKGVNDDAELDFLFNSTESSPLACIEQVEDVEGGDEEGGQARRQALSILQKRYNWPFSVSSAVVPGYSSDFNGTNLYAVFDSHCATAGSLAPNATAGYVLMREDTACRGVVIFAATTTTRSRRGGKKGASSSSEDNNNATHSSFGTATMSFSRNDQREDDDKECDSKSESTEVPILLSRRDILLLTEYNYLCGSLGVVSARVHFENIRRAESLLHLKSQAFTVI